MTITIQYAQDNDLDTVKKLCDSHRLELGFVMRSSIKAAIAAGEVMIVYNSDVANGPCVGFIHYHHRRDEQTTLYHIAVHTSIRGQGVGYALIMALRDEAQKHGKTLIRLKCPEPLSANHFYEKLGFIKVSTESGKSRPLCIWQMQFE